MIALEGGGWGAFSSPKGLDLTAKIETKHHSHTLMILTEDLFSPGHYQHPTIGVFIGAPQCRPTLSVQEDVHKSVRFSASSSYIENKKGEEEKKKK